MLKKSPQIFSLRGFLFSAFNFMGLNAIGYVVTRGVCTATPGGVAPPVLLMT